MLATALNERVKWGREQVVGRRKLCQEAYSRFLAALTDAHERMRVVALAGDGGEGGRAAAVLDVFRDVGCYQVRYEMSLVAGQEVLDGAEKCFQLLRDIRDEFAGGAVVESPEYVALRRAYRTALRELQAAMRVDLGAGTVDFAGGS
ncbi:hypothetical protein CRH09_02745 [Nocardia terpenica]|uniref:Uncharacterized protein n=1 Tax=Nocardia terpenica TaxID=455432 RepID=A0A291RDY2_9NOCA|nr:hypothetical protein CRH09_02745 [Nocardia terpenica]